MLSHPYLISVYLRSAATRHLPITRPLRAWGRLSSHELMIWPFLSSDEVSYKNVIIYLDGGVPDAVVGMTFSLKSSDSCECSCDYYGAQNVQQSCAYLFISTYRHDHMS